MEKEKWGFIDSGACSPSYNMALDEMLLHWNSKGLIPPIIRFYEWNPATLSIGYFQKIHKEIDLEAVERHGLGLVRRPTGGRGVLHDKELTYSVIVSEDHPYMPATVTEAYRVISTGLLEGFKALGLNAYFSVPSSESEREELKQPRSAVCFDAPSWYEMVVEGRKISGSAQTRQKGVIMQHGVLLIDLDTEQLFDVFLYPNERVRRRMQKAFADKAVPINDLTNEKLDAGDIRAAFTEGFERGLGIQLSRYELTPAQEKDVQELAKSRYENEEWTYRR
ncbi:lipoate--protein ligase family protein [Salicibibacter halophilus]|uniref:Lipoate--protein ligase family protein n=1 Tax=Salicibibacter halophilus TaxID=2502791 RepID=A0A514LMX5_9BACI|nr:biotin/lipoate A/B protein ligase family protein [Salicibibacter halophilus]QDI92925.1 lipoate--protein ligase family protein [Salicibibacter halophilus]